MDIWDTNKLLIFILFVIPGFFSIKVFSLFYPNQNRKFSDTLIDAIAYSCMNYAFWIIPIYFFFKNKCYEGHYILLWLFVVLILFISPIAWAYVWKLLRETSLFQKNMPHPTEKPWDYIFSKQIPYWIIVTLNDGTKIAGKYSYESFSSNSPSPEQLYLEECWKLNKNEVFKRKYEQTAGVLIVTSEISYIELYEIS